MLKPLFAKKGKDNLVESGKSYGVGHKKGSQNSAKPIDTQKELAKAAGVSHDTISKIELIERKATKKQKKKLEKGEASVNAVDKEIRVAEGKQKRTEAIIESARPDPEDLSSLGRFTVINSNELRSADFHRSLSNLRKAALRYKRCCIPSVPPNK